MEDAVQERVGRLVPIPDSCALLGGIGRTKLYELVNDGQISKVNIGSRAFITGESLENFLTRLAENPGGDRNPLEAGWPAGDAAPGSE